MSKKFDKTKVQRGASTKNRVVVGKKLSLSFKFVDFEIEYFFLHGLDKQFYSHLIEVFNEIPIHTAEDIKASRLKQSQLNPKKIQWHLYGTSKSNLTHSSFPIDKSSKIFSYIKAEKEKENENTTIDEVIKEVNQFVRDAYEIYITKNSGRIHGFIHDDIFYIVWFDPAHNLVLSKHMGKESFIQLPEEVQKIRPVTPENYQNLSSQLDAFLEMVAE